MFHQSGFNYPVDEKLGTIPLSDAISDFNASPSYTPATPLNRTSFDLPPLMPYDFTSGSSKSQPYLTEFGMYHSPPSTPASLNFNISHRNSSFSLTSDLSASPAIMPSSPTINDLSMLQSPYHYPTSLTRASSLTGSPLEQFYTVQDFLTSPVPSSPGFPSLDDTSSSCISPQFLPSFQDLGIHSPLSGQLSGSTIPDIPYQLPKKTKKRSSEGKKRKIPSSPSDITFHCPYTECDRIFTQAHNLKSHMICHSGKK